MTMILFRNICFLAMIWFVASWPDGAFALSSERTRLHVTFSLPDDHYRDNFLDPDLVEIEELTAAGIAEVFSKAMPFLEFGADVQAAYGLKIELDRAEGSGSNLPAEFGFHIALSGPGVPPDARSYLVFRRKDQFSQIIGSPDELLAEIRDKLESADHNRFIKEVLSHVPIAREGMLTDDLEGWIIARDRKNLCFDGESRLMVINDFPFPNAGRVKHAFQAIVLTASRPEIILRVDKRVVDTDMLAKLKAAGAGEIVVISVSVLEFTRRCPSQPIRGDQVDFSNAGDSQ